MNYENQTQTNVNEYAETPSFANANTNAGGVGATNVPNAIPGATTAPTSAPETANSTNENTQSAGIRPAYSGMPEQMRTPEERQLSRSRPQAGLANENAAPTTSENQSSGESMGLTATSDAPIAAGLANEKDQASEMLAAPRTMGGGVVRAYAFKNDKPYLLGYFTCAGETRDLLVLDVYENIKGLKKQGKTSIKAVKKAGIQGAFPDDKEKAAQLGLTSIDSSARGIIPMPTPDMIAKMEKVFAETEASGHMQEFCFAGGFNENNEAITSDVLAGEPAYLPNVASAPVGDAIHNLKEKHNAKSVEYTMHSHPIQTYYGVSKADEQQGLINETNSLNSSHLPSGLTSSLIRNNSNSDITVQKKFAQEMQVKYGVVLGYTGIFKQIDPQNIPSQIDNKYIKQYLSVNTKKPIWMANTYDPNKRQVTWYDDNDANELGSISFDGVKKLVNLAAK